MVKQPCLGGKSKQMTTMKRTLLLFGMALATLTSAAQTARLQVIHNAADTSASTVDIYVNGVMFEDDFDFRTATEFRTVPATVDLNIGIAPGNSTSVDDTLANFIYNLVSGETYVVAAQGIVSTSGYSPATPFGLTAYAGAREIANMMSNTDVLVLHGATDAPMVDVNESEVANTQLVNNLVYNQFAGYLELGTNDYVLDVADQNGNVVASYEAPLAGLNLDGEAITVVASGFLDPSVNSNGEAFGLFAALPTGGALVPLPMAVARLQVIHNSADDAASTVDVYANGGLLIDDFDFRTATEFIDVPANVDIEIAVAPGNSTGANQAFATVPVVLDARDTYVAIANGIESMTGYSPAPAFSLDVFDMGREEASMMSNTDVLVFHGSTDAPTVDVVESGVGAGVIVDDASYGDFAGYLELGTDDYILDVEDQAGNIVASFKAPLASLNLDGVALTVVASGFLDPSVNSDGPGFGLYAALPTGGALVELPLATARLQVIHNSADAAASTVDIYVNDGLLIDDFAFRTASAFIDAPARVDLEIAVAPGNSSSSAEAVATVPVTLAIDETYVAIANGIVSMTGYSPATPFSLDVFDMGREEATMMSNTDVLVFHGSTDAPTVDVIETGVGAGTIVDDASYGDFAGYLELGTADYVLDIADETGETTVARFSAPLADLSLDGAALVVVASGFLDPSVNSDGPAFGLWAATAAGGPLVELPSQTLSVSELDAGNTRIYPNPVTDGLLTIEMESATGIVELISMDGRMVMTDRIESTNTQLDLRDLAPGTYMLQFTANNGAVSHQKVQLVK